MANLLKPVNDPSLIKPGHSGRSTTALEKLSKMFGATDFVKVINPDTEAYIWQWLPPQKEEVSFDSSSSTVPVKITYRGEPEVWKIEAGQSGTLVGANAYIMIDGLVKRLMAKRTIARQPNMERGAARNFNFSDDVAQQEWINEIYLGIDSPFDNAVQTTHTPTDEDVTRQVDADLGLVGA